MTRQDAVRNLLRVARYAEEKGLIAASADVICAIEALDAGVEMRGLAGENYERVYGKKERDK